MKQYIKSNRILLVLLALAVAVSAAVIAVRWRAEADNKSYDIVLDYNELELLAEQSEHDVAWWLAQFRDMGITQVGLTEESLITLMENSPLAVTAAMMDEVIQDSDWAESYPAAFVQDIQRYGYDRFDVLVQVSGRDAAGFVVDAVERRFHSRDVVLLDQGEEAYILLNGTVNDTLYSAAASYYTTMNKGFVERREIQSSKLMYISLGLMPEKVETIQSLGMSIVPRTLCYNGRNDARYAQAVLEGYEKYGITPDYIIAGGEAVVGYDEREDAFALDYIQSNNITVGLIETNVQRENIMQSGVEDIARATDYNMVRVFSVWDYIQFRYGYYGYQGAEEIENTLYRAIVERNIRIIYFKPIKQQDNRFAYVTDPQIYRDMFESLDQRLAAHSIVRGRASVLENVQVPPLAMLVLGLGAGIGGALLPATCLPVKRRWTLLLAGAACVCVAGAWYAAPNSFRLLASFASAVVFACLAAAFFLSAAKGLSRSLPQDAGLLRILPRAALLLAGAVLIALCGAMMTAAPLSSTDYMLELGIFRGVKAAQLAPLAFFCVLFLAYYGLFEKDRQSNTLQIRDVAGALRWTIPVWTLALLGAVGAVGYYYLARTGHETDVTVSSVEIILRNILENNLLARPRTKEFLAAFPCAMLAAYCAVRRLPFWTGLFGLVSAIGLTSVCNTFMHIRTPLYLGFVRTGYSLVLGMVLGVIYVCCFELAYRLCRRIRQKYGETEQRENV